MGKCEIKRLIGYDLGMGKSGNPDTIELQSQSLLRLWDFNDPSASADQFARFRARAHEAGLDELVAMTDTQIARTHGLEHRFDDGLALIDSIEGAHPKASGELAVRLGLERGRLLNSSGKKPESVSHFIAAWEEAQRCNLDGLAVDAAHMLGIVLDGQAGLGWNERALALAIESDQPAANKWKGSLLNNMGWSYHGFEHYERAMELFEQALELRLEQGEPGPIRIARWCVGRCYRSLGKLDVALSIQRSLENDPAADGYVFEEIGECLHAMGEADEAKPSFAMAYELLSKDHWLVANDGDRLARLKALGT